MEIGSLKHWGAAALLWLPLSAAAQTYTRTDQITYHDNLSKWVIGQTASSKNTNTGVIEYRTEFDSTSAVPLRHYGAGTTAVPGQLKQTLTYNADGTVSSVKDGNNNTTTLSSWYRGIPRSIGYPGGATQSAVVNTLGLITSVTDENGFSTSYSYDAIGRLASIVYPTADSTAWNTTTQVFEKIGSVEHGIPAGHWRQTISTGNARKIAFYDGLWRPLVTHEYDTANMVGTQRFQRFAYDHEGRTTFASYPGANSSLTVGTSTGYDALGRPVLVSQNSELGVLNSTSEYLTGFKTRITNPRGQQTTTSYLAYDRPSTDLPVAVVHPEGVYADIERDVLGKPTSLTQRNASSSTSVTRRYVYDSYQQLCKSIEPETASTVMAYDNAGNLSWSASGQALPSTSSCDTASVATGQKVNRTYDARNRLTALTFADGNGSQSWVYTPDGLPDTVTTWNEGGASTVSNSYTYNKRRLLVSESQSQTAGSAVWSFGYTYNSNGHLASLVYPAGLTVDYLPNALGQPSKAGSFATGVTYHPNGAMKRFTYGNGLTHTLTQNTRQLPERSTDSGGVLDLVYAYDPNGNVASITDQTVAARQTRSMSYDGRDRLLTALSPMYPGGATYAYDVLDNLTQVKVAGRDNRYQYDANNRLTSATNGPGGPNVLSLGYDVRGNLNNKNGSPFVFDQGNRLRTAQGTQTYRYDALGRRVRTASAAGMLYEMYSQDGRLLWQRDELINARFQYVYLNGSVVAVRKRPTGAETEELIYWHTDALGSQIAATVGTTVVQTTEHEPFGLMLNRPNNNRMGYAGHVMDQSTGLIYMQQRYYDSMVGRFLSVDPVTANSGTGANFNRYWYANNNPYKFMDPDGRYRCYAGRRNCQIVDEAVKRARRALGKSKKDSETYKRLQGVVNRLGEKDTDGVEIYSKSLDEGTLGENESRGRVNVDFGQVRQYSSDLKGINNQVSGRQLEAIMMAGVLVHEGSHDEDRVGPGVGSIFPASRSQSLLTETRAYGIEAFYQAIERVTTGLSNPGMSITDRTNAINTAAGASTETWCSANNYWCR